MIKEAQFPKIKTVDLAMKPNVIDSRLMKKDMNFSPKKMDFTKANVKTTLTEVDLRLKKAEFPAKLKVVDDIIKGV